MTDQSEIARVAGKLTKACRDMLLALPSNGSLGCAPSRSVAKRAWWNITPPIIDHKHCPEDRNEWALNDFGLAVRTYLQEHPDV